MKKTEYKTYLFELFDAPVDGVSYEERMALIERAQSGRSLDRRGTESRFDGCAHQEQLHQIRENIW